MKYIYSLPELILIDNLINTFNKKGKKHIIKKEILKLFKKIKINKINNLIKKNIPYIELKTIRLGSNNYKIPIELKKKRQYFIFFKWLKLVVDKSKNNKDSIEKIFNKEFKLLERNEGNILKIKNELNREAVNNILYINYRW